MKLVIESPVQIAGETVRVIAAVEAEAQPLWGQGIWAHGAKRPVALLFGKGEKARLIGVDGLPCELEEFGLSSSDIE